MCHGIVDFDAMLIKHIALIPTRHTRARTHTHTQHTHTHTHSLSLLLSRIPTSRKHYGVAHAIEQRAKQLFE